MFIPYGRHCIEDDDIEAVSKALKRDYIATGPGIAEFEDAFAKYVGVRNILNYGFMKLKHQLQPVKW